MEYLVGTSPHVARFFQWYFMTNIVIYIINNELRYHCSINYRTVYVRHDASPHEWQNKLCLKFTMKQLKYWLDDNSDKSDKEFEISAIFFFYKK